MCRPDLPWGGGVLCLVLCLKRKMNFQHQTCSICAESALKTAYNSRTCTPGKPEAPRTYLRTPSQLGKSNWITITKREDECSTMLTEHVPKLFFAFSFFCQLWFEGRLLSQAMNSTKSFHVHSSWTVMIGLVPERTGDMPFGLAPFCPDVLFLKGLL